MNNWKDYITVDFLLGVFSAIISPLLVTFVPALEPLKENLTEIIAVLIAAILGKGLRDLGKYSNNR